MMNRYSDQELEEFRTLILSKIEKGQSEINYFRDILSNKGNGTDDTCRAFNVNEDGQDTLSREQSNILAQKQIKFVEALKSALVRIDKKTYGICIISGNLIPKERLLIVPHTTQCIQEKKKND